MSVPAQVLHLEELDTEIERAEAALGDVRRRRQRNPELEAAEARVRRLGENESAAVTHQRRLEAELADLQAKMDLDHKRLYGGQIVDVRELSSLERELAHYGEQRDALETRLLEAMEHAEAFGEELAAGRIGAQEARARWEQEQPSLEREEAELRQRLATLRVDRERAAAELDARTMSVYARLRTTSGHAVSAVRNGICQWCRVGIPPKDVQHARSGELVTCPNCARILFVGSNRP
jgi:predicted  nucleic acid-binding Zn-ribbon protein